MKETRQFTIWGRPVTKGYGMNEGRMFRNQSTDAQEEKIARLWNQYFERFKWFDDEKLAFSVRAFYPDNKRGDLKNLFYLAEDALSEVAYEDDSQIVMYKPVPYVTGCKEGDERTEIFVTELEEPIKPE